MRCNVRENDVLCNVLTVGSMDNTNVTMPSSDGSGTSVVKPTNIHVREVRVHSFHSGGCGSFQFQRSMLSDGRGSREDDVRKLMKISVVSRRWTARIGVFHCRCFKDGCCSCQ